MATSSGGGETPVKHLIQPTKSTPELTPTSTIENQKLKTLDSSPNPITPPNFTSVTSIPVADSKPPTIPATVNSRPRESNSLPDSDVIHVPSYSKRYDICARCYVRAGVNSADFKRVEISEEIKTDWTEKETLHLLEGVMHYGDDWKKVSEHVVGRSQTECVDRFIKLPFEEQYNGPPDSIDPEENPSKKMRPEPFDDASHPIVAQAAFLSTLVGVEVAERAASAAVKALTKVNNETIKERLESSAGIARNHVQLEKEEQELEKTISDIVEVQAKYIHENIVRFEELELQMEREWKQLQQMQNPLFVDQTHTFVS